MSKMIVRIVLLTVFLIIAGYFVAGPIFTNSEIKEKIDQLHFIETKGGNEVDFKTAEFLALPSIVSKFLKSSITLKSRPQTVAKLKLVGQSRDDQYSEWKPTTVDYHYSLSEPAYVWDATTEEFKILWARSIHTLYRNKAESSTKFLSSIITKEEEGVKLDHSSYLLYLLHSVFCPTVLLPTQDLHWTGVDHQTAEVVLWYKSVSGKVEFHFNESGLVDKIVAHDMYAPNTIEDEKLAFTIQAANYRAFDGIRIPTYLEYEWMQSEGPITVGRFNINSVEYK